MARPKKGEKGYEEAIAKHKATMLAKYGENGLHKMMVEIGRRGGKAVCSKPKCFAANHDRAVSAGRKGGHISRRGPSKKMEQSKPIKRPAIKVRVEQTPAPTQQVEIKRIKQEPVVEKKKFSLKRLFGGK